MCKILIKNLIIRIIQLWMTLDVSKFHPKLDCRKHPNTDDCIQEHYLSVIFIQFWMIFYGSFSSIFGIGTYCIAGNFGKVFNLANSV